VRVAPVLSDAQTTLSAGTDVSVADFAKRADYAVAEFTSNVTLIPTRPNNTPTTLSALTAGSVGIEKHNCYEKRNVNQLIAVRRMSDCNR